MQFVFISFEKDQLTFAELVAARLTEEGYAVWGIGRAEATQPDDAELLTEHMIRFADAVVAISGGNSAELEAAERFEKPIVALEARADPSDLLPKLQTILPKETASSPAAGPPRFDPEESRRYAEDTGRGLRQSAIIGPVVAAVVVIVLIVFALLNSGGGQSVEPSSATVSIEAAILMTETATTPPAATSIPLAVPVSTSTTAATATPTPTATSTFTATPTSTPTHTNTPTSTYTPTNTPTPSSTPTVTTAPTVTATPTSTATLLPTYTPSPTATSTVPALDATLIPDGAANTLWQPIERQIDGLMMVYAPGGCLRVNDEEIATAMVGTLCIEPYWMSKTDITNAQYSLCVSDGACTLPAADGSRTHDQYYDDPLYGNYPVINVTWTQAVAFASWFGGTLPSQLQWRYAVGGPSGWPYPWGSAAPDATLLNFNATVGDVTEVGTYPKGASWIGALDLVGNVWEWTTTQEQANPVICGGSWDSYAGLVNANTSATNPQSESNVYTGFRVVLDPAAVP